MRTHEQIISAAGPTAFAAKIGVEANTVFQWRRLNSIPAAYWRRVAEAELSTLDELAIAAEARKLGDSTPEQVEAAA